MRTNIVVDEKLIAQALELTGLKTQRKAVEAGLDLLVKMARQQRIRATRGKFRWRKT